MAVLIGKVFVFALVLLIYASTRALGTCTKVITAAKSAYNGQLDYIRRGLKGETAQGLYAEYIANLAAKVWQVAPFTFTFGDTCIDDNFLSMLQDENGTLRSTANLAQEVVDANAKVPLLSAAELAGQDYDTSIADTEWSQTSAYLSGFVPAIVDVFRLVFPSEGSVRVDPHKIAACYQFEGKHDITGFSTMPADNYTANVMSLVTSLINSGVNATKARQLLKHCTAFIYVGARCRGVEKSELQVPTVFLATYARHTAWLIQNASVPTEGTKYSASRLLKESSEVVGLLSSFHSGGRLPEKVITTSGHLGSLNFAWESVSDLEHTISDSKEVVEDPDRYLLGVEDKAAAAIKATIASVYDETFKLTRKASFLRNLTALSRRERNNRRRSDVIGRTRSLLKKVSAVLRDSSATHPKVRRPEMLETTVRNACASGTCSGNYTCIERPGVTHWHEHCCATLCSTAAQGLSAADTTTFQEVCCNECNEYNQCSGGAQNAADAGADVIDIPLFGPDDDDSTPVMI